VIEIDSKTPKKSLGDQLRTYGWLFEEEKIREVEMPGEGNMNVVLRVTTNKRSFILKQSRPYVQKFKQIEAPLERIGVEYQFYRSLKEPSIRGNFPRILAYNPSHYLMQLEDLGDCSELYYWYEAREIDPDELKSLVGILSAIHAHPAPEAYPENMELRRLNHQHIFVLPFMEDNGFHLDDIQKGLQDLALPYKNDREINQVVKAAGEHYLKPGKVLLHGDYYPGSWMRTKNKLFVIDPEFSFLGFPEFDLGVMTAHAIMATGNTAYTKSIKGLYGGKVSEGLVCKIAGIEIMRRLIGLAQLPLQRNLEEKEYLLSAARNLILQ
jgi:5-methylthioribose kinase